MNSGNVGLLQNACFGTGYYRFEDFYMVPQPRIRFAKDD